MDSRTAPMRPVCSMVRANGQGNRQREEEDAQQGELVPSRRQGGLNTCLRSAAQKPEKTESALERVLKVVINRINGEIAGVAPFEARFREGKRTRDKGGIRTLKQGSEPIHDFSFHGTDVPCVEPAKHGCNLASRPLNALTFLDWLDGGAQRPNLDPR